VGTAHDTREASAAPTAEAAPASPDRAPRALGAGLTPAVVARLQRSAGNAAVTALIQREAKTEATATSRRAAPKQAIQRGFWGSLWRGIKKVGKAIGGAAEWVYEGAKSVGSHIVDWVKKAGSHVLDAIKWFGSKSWEVIKVIGTVAWEKLSLLGTLAWTFVTNLPVRLWRLVIDGWEGIKIVLGWTWDGLKGAAGKAWDAVVGVFDWLKEGADGALGWLWKGLKDGAEWAIDFASKPTLGKLWDALTGTLSWLGKGVAGLGKWGWRGAVAAAKWAWDGLKGLGLWLWEGFKDGGLWALKVVLHLFEAVGGMEALQLIWGVIFRMRTLTGAERLASEDVHGKGLIPYWKVRVDENSYLIKIGQALAKLFGTKTSPAAITTMHVIHAPKRLSLPIAVHELTHVAQYEKVGGIYMPQALHGQGTSMGYNYGHLGTALAAGKQFKDFNREQQASICEDYYKVRHGLPADYGATEAELRPFIGDMRLGKF
jgi:hypothetical protein